MEFLVKLSFVFVFMFFSCTSEESTDQTDLIEDSSVVEESGITGSSLSDSSDISCPKCGYSTVEVLPTDVCLLSYPCKSCGEVMHPAEGDCCVFCTYGSEKCPSMQE